MRKLCAIAFVAFTLLMVSLPVYGADQTPAERLQVIYKALKQKLIVDGVIDGSKLETDPYVNAQWDDALAISRTTTGADVDDALVKIAKLINRNDRLPEKVLRRVEEREDGPLVARANATLRVKGDSATPKDFLNCLIARTPRVMKGPRRLLYEN